jgi:hypothetical protein
MRIIVTGDRFWFCNRLAAAIVRRLVARYGPEITIVHGAAPGVDESFEMASHGLGVKTEPHPADWKQLGNKTGPIRNQEMIEAGAELCIAFHRTLNTSRGTKNCVTQSLEAGIPTYLVDSDAAEPVRIHADDLMLK